MLLLIDADSALYRAGFANEERSYLCTKEGALLEQFQYKAEAKEFAEQWDCDIQPHSEAGPVGITLHNLRQTVENFFAIEHSGYEMYVGGGGNFRYDVFPEYKANRKSAAKPKHMKQMIKHLKGKYGAVQIEGEEVDDRVSWRQMQCSKEGVESCIVSIDKDLDNTPGWHYNWSKNDMYYITPEQADLNFARQLLMGDSTDGIPGLPKVGKKKAEAILPQYREDWLEVVKDEYESRGFGIDYLTQQGVCLWMRREPDEMWTP